MTHKDTQQAKKDWTAPELIVDDLAENTDAGLFENPKRPEGTFYNPS
ncbi:hypothetical protein GCM10007939_20900 [Amylibacter marinus]|uniref:Paeninodin family lasso peptide n=1 Tax=Amylibacter marinus TaxID=1475483 RepID=A0ABQ5VX83_9RHOB|nr:hypothetical protein [Amylibacter marinus]GLQ35807.1 hypothetical protein GCM10007939_20900 [Amylibacter marinus]